MQNNGSEDEEIALAHEVNADKKEVKIN